MSNTIKNIIVGIIIVVIGGAILIYGNTKYSEYRIKKASEDYARSIFIDAQIKSRILSLFLVAEIFSETNTPSSYKGLCEHIKNTKREFDSFMTDWEYIDEMSKGNAYCRESENYSDYKISAKLSNGDYYCLDTKAEKTFDTCIF